jgi:hypothetical protein
MTRPDFAPVAAASSRHVGCLPCQAFDPLANDAARPRWSGLSVEEFVSGAVRIEADIVRRHAGALRVIALSTATNPAASTRGTHAVRDTEHRFRDHLQPRLDAAGCAEAGHVATTIFRMAFGALINRVTWPDQQADPEIPWPRFVDDLCHMTSVYATCQTRASAPA